MKVKGNEIVGNDISVDSYTSKWIHVRVHPLVFFRRYDKFIEGFKQVKGLFAEIDQGEFISIRFSDKSDLTTFHRLHHEYL